MPEAPTLCPRGPRPEGQEGYDFLLKLRIITCAYAYGLAQEG